MSDISEYATTLEFNKDPSAKQPSYIKQIMKPHQLMTLYKCLNIEKGVKINNNWELASVEKYNSYNYKEYNVVSTLKSIFGAICDPVGSGKTLTVLSLIGQDCLSLEQDNTTNTLAESGMVNIMSVFSEKDDYVNESKFKNLSAIVVQHNLVQQWQDTIDKYTSLKYIIFKKNTDLEKEIDKNPLARIVLVANTSYRMLYQEYGFIQFDRIFYDEADSIKLPNCKKLKSKFYWFVTASYKSLYGCMYDNDRISCNGFIKHTFEKTDYRIKKHLIIRNDEKFIHNSFNLQDYKTITIKCLRFQFLNILENVVSDRIQQMICAGDIEGAINTFNLDSTSEDNIISVVCKDLFNKLSNKKAKLDYARAKTYSTSEAKKESIERIEFDIKRIEDSIESIQQKINESDLDPITYMEIENPVITKCCKTSFDFESITMYILSKPNVMCPICRTPITKQSLIIISNVNKEDEEEKEEWLFENNRKIENIKYIIKNICQEDARILIFSEFDETSNILLKELSEYTIKQLKGQMSVITNTINWFKDNKKEKKILFLNAQYAGAGINLENTTDVFIYHNMASDLTGQTIGRAQRPGRTSVLNVYEFDES